MLVRRALASEPAGGDANSSTRAVWMIAVGKAAAGMASAAYDTLGGRIASGLVITPGAVPIRSPIPGVEFARGGHPVPTRESEIAGRRALAFAESVPPSGRLLVLLSGGASALMAVPVPPITLEDKQQATERLLRNGADIHALNTVRKHLSAIKGGQLAVRCQAPVRTLAISDVVGDDLSVVGSGPTVPDASTFKDAYRVLQQFGGHAGFSDRVVQHIRRGLEGDLVETPKPDDPRFAHNDARVIGGRHTAMDGAARAAGERAYHVRTIDEPVLGEARVAAALYAQRVRGTAADGGQRPLCVISSGETTVQVRGNGRGGRNQEFALALSESMTGASYDWIAASVGTDGVDGPTDAAGARVDRFTAQRALDAQLPPARSFLDANDSYAYFAALGDLITTGPTGTNVGDIQILLLP